MTRTTNHFVDERTGRLVTVEYKRPLKKKENDETITPTIRDLVRSRGLDGGLLSGDTTPGGHPTR